jgi:trehalose 6-phosphate synthase
MATQLLDRPRTTLPDNRPLGRLVLVSNRGPIEHFIDDFGRLRRRPAGGGVAVALSSVLKTEPVTWIAAACGFADRVASITKDYIPLGDDSDLRLLNLPDAVYDAHYQTFCNPLLWFVQHSLADQLSRRDVEAEALAAWRDGYVQANRIFAAAVIDALRGDGSGERVMLHDYHLYLASRLIRLARPNVAMQQFVHIPWPGAEVWQALPAALVREICRGLLGNDSVVFQTDGDVENFLNTCRVYLGDEVDIRGCRREVRHDGRITEVWSNPISVDLQALESLSESAEVASYKAELSPARKEQLIVRVDRLDPSKNVHRGFEAYELLLRRNKGLRGRVRFAAFLVPSRAGIPEYDDYAERTLALVERINAEFGTPDWQPISLYYEQNRARALAGLALYDVLLVNSVADGMNLVAKEGAALNERDGVLVLSREAGCFEQLSRGCLPIDPPDVPGTADALERALTLGAQERRQLADFNRFAVSCFELEDWLRAQLKDLAVCLDYRNLTSKAVRPSFGYEG